MNIEATLYGDLMEKYYRRWRVMGFTQTDSPEEFYGFHYNHVAEVHVHKQGEGDGIWFRLHDGRVFDIMGHPDEPDRLWYDKTAH